MLPLLFHLVIKSDVILTHVHSPSFPLLHQVDFSALGLEAHVHLDYLVVGEIWFFRLFGPGKDRDFTAQNKQQVPQLPLINQQLLLNIPKRRLWEIIHHQQNRTLQIPGQQLVRPFIKLSYNRCLSLRHHPLQLPIVLVLGVVELLEDVAVLLQLDWYNGFAVLV